MNQRQPIIICGEDESLLVERVTHFLEAKDVTPVIIMTEELGKHGLTCSVVPSSESLYSIGDAAIDDRSSKIWWRRGTWPKPHQFSESDPVIAQFIARQYSGALKNILSLAYSYRENWMNHPQDESLIDENKILQHRMAKEAGLDVVPLLCTDNVEHAISFAQRYGVVAIKPVGGFIMKTKNALGKEIPLSLFTRRLSLAEFMHVAQLVTYAPILMQPYVEKKYELRVTIVGDTCLAARIDSQESERTRVDWRNYDLNNTPHSIFQLNPSLEEALQRFMRIAKLHFAAIDMIVTPDDEIVFLEANPCGQYGWIEDLTGLPISETIASWLLPVLQASARGEDTLK